ncbi:NAD(P)-dependent oxidoreductase [Promicromonospora thailandica]|uniref:2-hydroxy-3-oxopropionate reductase n=1 Tax=Promicromonospora thailandica TaxID=765201 RepID=A0A9X2FZY2_9MICO|nr:NAD(P)-binding domain-containing protein [Promicromonospora thailandica]MCP2264475.1 2-hydroxy-3-oxopropionate reductase [Promicromonospora thailandica]BFF20466.1 2-hydroxy-3-oxopropionate reductase [Promicromonospora thailandica]
MAVVGFVGLGVMGRPMAANLVRAGHEVRAFSRGAAGRERAAELGVPVVGGLAEAVRGADVVITMLPDTPDVRAVALGPDGVLEHLGAGAAYIDMSTIEPGAAREVAERFTAAGHDVLDAPVSGGEAGAREGTLSVMVGGPEAVVERWRELLGALGTTVVRVGDAGSGQVVKAANQLVVATHLQALAEAVVFLEAHDADVATALSVIARGLGGSTVIDRKAAAVLTGDFAPGFRLDLHHKDLGIVQGAARARGAVLPVTGMVGTLVQALVQRGDGGLDHSALVALARELNGSGSAPEQSGGPR